MLQQDDAGKSVALAILEERVKFVGCRGDFGSWLLLLAGENKR